MKRRRKRRLWPLVLISVLIVVLATLIVVYVIREKEEELENPGDLLMEYINHIEQKEYDAMYAMVEPQSVADIEKEGFIERNSNIYEGIEAKNLKIQNIEVVEQEKDYALITYHTSFDSIAGEIAFDNEVEFIMYEDGYKLVWSDRIIFPELKKTDKVTVSNTQAERGDILDRNGYLLAGKGTASSVGIVPGKLENREEDLKKLSELLNVELDTIESKLQAKWVKDDLFVPIKTIEKISEEDLLRSDDEEIMAKKEFQEKLLEIPGVMLSDEEVRLYRLGAAAAHLIGYIQSVTAEDLEKHPGEGYHSNSVIGRTGIESLLEKKLKGQNGHEVCIKDENGEIKECLAKIAKVDGEDIKLTIDAFLQRDLYEQYKDEPGSSVAMNPYTGEVLALVSTPSYDNNVFIRGMDNNQWNALNDDEQRPLYNRFRQTWSPGSVFKPIIAAIGLETGSINPDEDFGREGLSWQKDESWGSYHVTTLKEYEPVIMENALIYSDNIYFAKSALKIGTDKLEESLEQLGFNENMPFEITMSESQYSNSDGIESEIQLADSGYGQGQILLNPLHLASLYTAFANDGNVIKPYLLLEEGKESETWIEQAFSKDVTDRVLEAMKKVVNDPNGTGYKVHREDISLAGKTGTAEIKSSQGDTTGTEIGWFSVFTTEKDVQNPLLLVSMVENVKEAGGSGYVVEKSKDILDNYLQRTE